MAGTKHPRSEAILITPQTFFRYMSVLLLSMLSFAMAVAAQGVGTPKTTSAPDATIPALMISDIHFDPFHAPDRVARLAASDVSQWESILAPASSPAEEQAFNGLQEKCNARGVDTPYALLRSSLRQMQSRVAHAQFITVSGDLIAHAFTCRYRAVLPALNPAAYQDLVVKTIRFVVEQLHVTFPGIPIYVALGNNDTACGDYRMDTDSSYLSETAQVIASTLPVAEQKQVLRQFRTGGYYSVTMALPMRDTRLIVVNDIFLSKKYNTCKGAPDPLPADAEMTWLQEQLEQARRHGQRVWVMGHIPPGIDVYSTLSKFRDVCGGQPPDTFLATDRMTDLLVHAADIVKLGIFAHTHMDEFRLLEPARPDVAYPTSVAVKMVPSISPVDGNNPSFMIAQVNPSTAMLQDYEEIAASDHNGDAWASEYDYGHAYHEASFSPGALGHLIAEFKDDPKYKTEVSQQYLRSYYKGQLQEIKPFWPQYACALGNNTAQHFAACVCAAHK
jgi:sphingomyelin phosphodiesterase acid-like 3